jgi:hypothetical protein
MKPYLLITLLLVSIQGFTQPKVIHSSQRSWAGGVCCSGGTTYRITLAGSKDVIENIEIKIVGLQGRNYELPQVTRNIQHKDSLSYMILEFGFTYTHYTRDYILDEIIEKPKKVEEGIFYTLHGANAKLVIGEIKELDMIAYP